MAVALQRRRLTVDGFHRMAESGVFGDDERLELWDGELFDMTPIRRRHAHAVRLLKTVLSELAPDRAIVDVQNALVVDEHAQVSPDVMLLRPRADAYRDLPTPSDGLLLVEVADSSLAFDRGPRAACYADAGIPEYWVVDVSGRCVWVMTQPGAGGYGDVHRHEGGTLMAMGVPVEVGALF